jgi:hypothetical protein
MNKSLFSFAASALAGTLCLPAVAQPTSYAPPLPICKRPFAP